jgi:hypothetical protein
VPLLAAVGMGETGWWGVKIGEGDGRLAGPDGPYAETVAAEWVDAAAHGYVLDVRIGMESDGAQAATIKDCSGWGVDPEAEMAGRQGCKVFLKGLAARSAGDGVSLVVVGAGKPRKGVDSR